MSRDFPNLSPPSRPRAGGRRRRCWAWQATALEQYLTDAPGDFLAVATPAPARRPSRCGSPASCSTRGSSTGSPSSRPRAPQGQWADAAHRAGIALDPGLGGSRRGGRRSSPDRRDVCRRGRPALPLPRGHRELQHARHPRPEIHHAGDARTWGEAVAECFAPARRRLALTGTPFRSDDNLIPFVRYEELPDGSRRSTADYTYGYAEALRDHVVRPVLFMAYGGPMRWRIRPGRSWAQLAEPMTKGSDRARVANGVGPQGRVDPGGPARGRCAADRDPSACPGRGRAGDRDRSGERTGIRQSVGVGERDETDARARTTPGRHGGSRSRGVGGPVAGRRADGLGGVDVPRLCGGILSTATDAVVLRRRSGGSSGAAA